MGPREPQGALDPGRLAMFSGSVSLPSVSALVLLCGQEWLLHCWYWLQGARPWWQGRKPLETQISLPLLALFAIVFLSYF